MTQREKIMIVLSVLPAFIFMSSGEEGYSSHFLEFLGKTVNFIVLFGGLFYFLFKPVRNFLMKRVEDIKHSLKEAEDSKKEAKQKLQEVESRLAGLKNELERIKREGKEEGAKEAERIHQLTRQDVEKIKYFTKQEIEMLVNAGIQHLKEYTAELAISLAEEKIKKRMSSQDQSLLIDKSCEKVESLYEE